MSRTFTCRRATILALLCAPSLSSVPFSHAFQFPKFMEDEFDQEEDALVELFAVCPRLTLACLDSEI